MVKYKDSSQVQAELDVGREMCIVFQKCLHSLDHGYRNHSYSSCIMRPAAINCKYMYKGGIKTHCNLQFSVVVTLVTPRTSPQWRFVLLPNQDGCPCFRK